MVKLVSISFMLALTLLPLAKSVYSAERSDENRILPVLQKMESAFKTMEDYTCEVEQIFYQDGVEDQRYRFKFYFKRDKKIRVDFSHPYPSLTIFFEEGDKEATVIPFRFLPAMKFRFSIDNPMIKTLAGQRIDQTDMGYFMEFIFKNMKKVKQGEDEFYEDGERIRFVLWAKDYIEEKVPEKYGITISKKNWFPIHIERHNLEGKRIEATDIKNYTMNTHLENKLFHP
jgi:outer membrane lipoprotein-sorting protein